MANVIEILPLDTEISRHAKQRTENIMGDWNLQDWKMTDNIAGVEIAGLDNERLEIGGLENDGLH